MQGSRLLTIGKLLLASTIIAGCGAIGGGNAQTPSQPAGPPAVAVTVARATTGPISQQIGFNGTVQAADTVNVAPQITGQIVKLNVDVGSQVKAGDLIAQLDQTTLNAQVEQAQAGVDAANVKLAQIQAGARPEAIDEAQANAAGAEAKLQAIQNGARSETVAQAKANLDVAQAKLKAIQEGARPQNVAVAKANLDAAQAKLKAIQEGARPQNVAVAKANLVAAQAKLQQLKDGPTPDQVAASQLSVQQAQNSLYSAQASRDGVCGNAKNPGYQCQSADAQVDAAQTSLNTAQQNLKILTDPPTQDAINQDQAAVNAAQQQLLLAQQPYLDTDVAQAQAAVNAAQQQYLLAQQPYLDTDVAQAQAAVNAAQQAYALAAAPYTSTDVTQAQAAAQAAEDQAKLAAQPYTDLDVKAAQVAIAQAQAALDIAKANLRLTNVYAPFDGVVTAKLLSEGALATPGTPIVSIMSPHLQVQFAIDEASIANIKAGQTVSLISPAYPGKTFPATVANIYPTADPKTHTFTVVVDPQDTSGAIRAGMFVTLNVTTASFPNATLIPSVAIIQIGSQSVVYTISNNVAHQVPVETGISDDTNTQILSGVKPGDEVATINQTNLSDGAKVRVAGSGGAPAGQSGSGRSGASGSRPASGTATSGRKPATTPTATPAG